MSNGAKKIIMILAALFLVSAGVAFFALSQKAVLEQSKAELEDQVKDYKDKTEKLVQENKRLDGQLKDTQTIKEKLQRQMDDLTSRINNLSVERDDWKNRVEALQKERDEIIAKLQEAPQQPDSQEVAEGETVAEEMKESSVKPSEAPAISGEEKEDKYWAEVLKEKAALGIKLSQLQTELSGGTVEVEELKKKNSDLELEVTMLKNEKEEIERKIKYSEDLINSLSIELAREKKDKRYFTDRLDKFKEENLALRSQVKELATAKVNLEKGLAKLTEDKNSIQQKLAETQSVIQNRIDDILEIKGSLEGKIKPSAASPSASKEIELPPIIVSAQGVSGKKPEGPMAGFDGHVVTVDEANNFVVVDLGEKSGLRVGDTLSIYRGEKYIAGLEVIQVRKDISAADIKQKGTKIKVGDAVR